MVECGLGGDTCLVECCLSGESRLGERCLSGETRVVECGLGGDTRVVECFCGEVEGFALQGLEVGILYSIPAHAKCESSNLIFKTKNPNTTGMLGLASLAREWSEFAHESHVPRINM